MTPRKMLADALTARLGGDYLVIGYARQLDPPARRTVMVWTEKTTPSPVAAGVWEVTLGVWALTPCEDPEAIEDNIDAMTADLFASILPLPAFAISSAERQVHEGSGAQGIRLTITAGQTIKE